MHNNMLIKTKTFHFGLNTADISGNMIIYKIKNEDYKSKSDTGYAAADRMATNR